MDKADLRQGFYFGELLVEPLRGQVSGTSISEHLPPTAAEVLVCLASKPGELVTRDELLREVWGDDQGSQEALNHAVSEIRQALHDRHDDPAYVQTLPKRGYRLLVTPELVAESTTTVVLGADQGARVTDVGILQNLKQRGVLETALAYLIVGWLIIQIVDIIFDQLLLPQWMGTFVTVLVIAGFPIAVLLSWFLEFRHGRAVVVDKLTPSDLRKRRFSRTYISVISALAIAAALVFLYDRNIGLPETEDGIAESLEAIVGPRVFENSIAVLPFLNIDGSETTQTFANGLVDDVITRLARVPGLLVSSRGDSHTLEPNTASQRVRERLRVAMYLEGSVQMIDGQLRVIVQLIDSNTGFHVLSRSFDRPREDFFDVRDEITELTVANVRVALPEKSSKGPIADVEDSTLDAYLLYRRGIDASRDPATGSFAKAIEYYDAALEIDPDYAAAHAGKCIAYAREYVESSSTGLMTQAESACATALELNPNLEVVHVALGNLYEYLGLHEQALAAFGQALASNPKHVGALIGTGRQYAEMQQLDKAEDELKRATTVEPGNWHPHNNLGTLYFNLGRYAEAADQYEMVLALDSTNMVGHSNLGTALMLAGEFERAATVLEVAADAEPRAITFSNLGLVKYYLGRLDEAIAAHTRATQIAPEDHLAWSGLADALWAAGNETESIAAYEQAEAHASDALKVNPSDAYTQLDLAWISTMLGRPDEAQRYLERAQPLADVDPVFHYIHALIRVRGGETDEAVGALETCIERGFSAKTLAVDPLLEPLRGNARFEALVSGSG